MNVFNRVFILFGLFGLFGQPADSFVINPAIKRNYYLEKTRDWRESSNIKRIDPSKIFLLNMDLPPPPDNPATPTLVDHMLDITIRDKYLGKLIVEKISAFLPRVDTIGHDVLHANNEFIDYILNDTNLSEIMKKKIVLMSIQLAIMGDNMGSTFLHLYYDIVDKCL